MQNIESKNWKIGKSYKQATRNSKAVTIHPPYMLIQVIQNFLHKTCRSTPYEYKKKEVKNMQKYGLQHEKHERNYGSSSKQKL